MMLDQAYWGHRVAELGAGPEPLPVGEWTLPRLTAAIRDLISDGSYKTRAEEVGLRMRADGGAAAAARIIRNFIGTPDARAA
jgi:UDP:flavonoid glycosyltransferase YjiC (YdhE family)